MSLSSIKQISQDEEPATKVSPLTTTTDPSATHDVNGNGPMNGAASSSEQPSPAVSDSHTSASSAQHSIDSPVKCFDCVVRSHGNSNVFQTAKAKLQMSDNKVRALEAKIGSMEMQQGRLEGKLVELETLCKEHMKEKAGLKMICEAGEVRLRECQVLQFCEFIFL